MDCPATGWAGQDRVRPDLLQLAARPERSAAKKVHHPAALILRGSQHGQDRMPSIQQRDQSLRVAECPDDGHPLLSRTPSLRKRFTDHGSSVDLLRVLRSRRSAKAGGSGAPSDAPTDFGRLGTACTKSDAPRG